MFPRSCSNTRVLLTFAFAPTFIFSLAVTVAGQTTKSTIIAPSTSSSTIKPSKNPSSNTPTPLSTNFVTSVYKSTATPTSVSTSLAQSSAAIPSSSTRRAVAATTESQSQTLPSNTPLSSSKIASTPTHTSSGNIATATPALVPATPLINAQAIAAAVVVPTGVVALLVIIGVIAMTIKAKKSRLDYHLQQPATDTKQVALDYEAYTSTPKVSSNAQGNGDQFKFSDTRSTKKTNSYRRPLPSTEGGEYYENCNSYQDTPIDNIIVELESSIYEVSKVQLADALTAHRTCFQMDTQEPDDLDTEQFWMPPEEYEEIYQRIAFREIPRDQIQVLANLGSGEFGTVNRGKWNCGTISKDVALRMLKDAATPQDGVKFLQEAAINGQFHHQNVVELYGVVTIGNPVMIVLELLSNGDLRNYLLKQNPSPGEMLPSTWPNKLLKFCQQVASGMTYLSRKGFVHRDLAARNVLLSENCVCKIADFGMSRNLNDDEYYVSRGEQIPVKWTAPEAIQFKKYSTMSDVWSFGAVMYEIWSLGGKPYEAYSNQQVFNMISNGARAAPPPGCPRAMYNLIIQCWNPDKDLCPTFKALVTALGVPPDNILAWSQTDTQTCPEATVLGAPLALGEQLYPDLQNAYLNMDGIYS